MSHSYLVIFYVDYEVVDPLCEVENFIDHFSYENRIFLQVMNYI